MFPDILAAFGFIPFEAQVMHLYIVHNQDNRGNGFSEHILLDCS